jgi:hypothetical protein
LEDAMKKLRVLIYGLLIAALLFMTASVPSVVRATSNPGVVSPHARVQGLTYGQWEAKAFRYLFEIPADQNPGIGAPWTNCYLKRVGKVGVGVTFFLTSGTFNCQMPTGMFLFLPVIGTECSSVEPPPFYGETYPELRACAESFVIQDLAVSVDGVPLKHLQDYISTSPLYTFTLPENNVLGLPAGTAKSVARGLALMFTPFSPGKHTLVVHGAMPDAQFIYTWTYNITVTHSR